MTRKFQPRLQCIQSATGENLTETAQNADRWKGYCETTGPNESPAELFKAGETVLDRMHRICVTIWETGEWPEEQTFCTFIPLPKKDDIKQCAHYRTIAHMLVSHASKNLRIILERIRVKTETEIAEEQKALQQGMSMWHAMPSLDVDE